MKHRFTEELEVKPTAQPNVAPELTLQKMAEDDKEAMEFYEHGWFAKVRPYYRDGQVDFKEMERALQMDLEEEDDIMKERFFKISVIFEFFLYSSLFMDANPELFERLLAKFTQAAGFPDDFKRSVDVFFPWIKDYMFVPTFKLETETNSMSGESSPIDYMVWVHTIRLMHDREPLTRLNIDMKNVEDVERRLGTVDIPKYYRDLYRKEAAAPPYYLLKYWEDNGIEADIMQNFK